MIGMLYLFHVIKGGTQILDPEGSEFADLEAAKQEAGHAARELAVEELRNGRPIPLNWHIAVADRFGNLRADIGFESVLLRSATGRVRRGAHRTPYWQFTHSNLRRLRIRRKALVQETCRLTA